MTEQSFNFDEGHEDGVPALKQIPVTFRGKQYLLVEALADAVAVWRNAQLSGTKMQANDNSDTRVISLGSMADAEPVLVGYCLFEPDRDGNLVLDQSGNINTGRRLKDKVKSWPQRVISPLFDKVMEISGLKEQDTLESLDKRIADLQKRRDKLAASKETHEEDMLAKNSL